MHWEAYIATQYAHARDGVSATAPHFELNYGAAPNLQIHLIAPFNADMPASEPRQYGFGDTEIGAKYRLVQETARAPMVGVFPIVELPTGAPSKGLGNGEAQFFLPVWIQKTFGSWTTYGGGGYWRNPGDGNHDYWFFGWQAQCQITKQCALGLEVFHSTKSTVDGTDRTGFNIGAVYDLDSGHHALFSAGRDFRGENVGTFYVGFQWTFGPTEKQ